MDSIHSPRAVIGLPLYNKAHLLEETLNSWRVQSRGDFVVLMSDDHSPDNTREVAQAAADADPRFILLPRSDSRLGYVGNTRRLLAEARRRYPEAEFFTWGSDHDLWHPLWLERTVKTLDDHPEASLVWCLTHRIDEQGRVLRRSTARHDNRGITDPVARFRDMVGAMIKGDAQAGNMIYGLFRLSALPEAAPPPVLLPDRLVVLRAAWAGPCLQVPEFLWFRRYEGISSPARQRDTLFAGHPPFHAHLPIWLTHAAVLTRQIGVARALDFLTATLPAWTASRLRRWQGHGRRRIGYGLLKPMGMAWHRLRKRVKGKLAGLKARLKK